MSNARPSVALIVEAAGAATGMTARQIVSARRDAEHVRARQLVYLLADDMTGLEMSAIGRLIGGRDRATVSHGLNAARALAASDESFADLVAGTRLAVQALMETAAANAFLDPDPKAVAERIIGKPHLAAMLRVSARDLQAMAARLVALEDTARSTLQLLRIIDELCAGAPGQVRRRLLAREARGLISTLAHELTELDIEETDHGEDKEQDAGSEFAGAAE